MVAVLAFTLLALMGAVIAYTGDLLGRRMGKKRVTIGKLRPKHTAILITSVTGLFISGTTALALFLTVPAINVAIVKGESLIRDNIDLARNLKLAKASEADLDHRLSEKSSKLVEADANASKAMSQATTAQLRADGLDKQVAQKQVLVDGLEIKRKALQESVGRLEKSLARLAHDNETLAKATAQLDEAYNKAQERNYALQREKDDLNKQVASLNRQITAQTKVETDLKNKNSKLQSDIEEGKKEFAALKKQTLETYVAGTADFITEVENKKKECATLQAANVGLKAENARLTRLLDSVDATKKQLATDYDRLRTDRIAIHRGEDLARITIPAQSAPDVVRTQVKALLSEAHLVALNRGASLGVGGRSIEFEPITSPSEDSSSLMSDEDYIDGIVRTVEWSPSPVCILVEAVQNTRMNAPAKINFRPYTNRLVYARNQKLGSRRIDSAMPPAQIVSELIDFVKEAGQSALTKGVIPRYDGSGDPQVGSLSMSELAELMDEIRNVGRAARISAWTSRDIYSSDKLELRFRVDPGP